MTQTTLEYWADIFVIENKTKLKNIIKSVEVQKAVADTFIQKCKSLDIGPQDIYEIDSSTIYLVDGRDIAV